MRNITRILIIVLIVTFISAGCRGEREVIEDAETPMISSDKLSKTVFVSNMSEALKDGNNVIYCSTFQLAWNKFKEYAEGDLTFIEKLDEADRLNKSAFKERYISEDAYVSEIGKVADGIEAKINEQLKMKFPKLNKTYKFDTPTTAAGDQIVSYSFLYKNLQFAKAFEKLEKDMHFEVNVGNYEKVRGFGFDEFDAENHGELRKQVDVIKFDENVTIIKLLSKSTDDELVLAMIKPENDLLSTYVNVTEFEKVAKTDTTSHLDYLRIPVIDFNITHSYKQFLNKTFTNPKLAGYFITEARQDIEFKLNEKGAVLKSEAEIVAEKLAMKESGIAFNKPFLLIMRKKDAELPYFLCWVANPEIMKQ